MAENQKNLCAMIPEELHSRVRAAQEQAGVTLSAYITGLLTDYYEGGEKRRWKKECAPWPSRCRRSCSCG